MNLPPVTKSRFIVMYLTDTFIKPQRPYEVDVLEINFVNSSWIGGAITHHQPIEFMIDLLFNA
jgi:hypothetical protein